MYGDGLMHYVCNQQSDEEEVDDDNDNFSNEDDGVGKCPVCHYFGEVNKQCPHCPAGTFFFGENRNDHTVETSSDEELPAAQEYPENHEIEYINLLMKKPINDLKQRTPARDDEV